ncbi:hypothetical protein COCCU_13210 [Corynebacterium occultum]|uniref:DUF5129 domain-containing protein n=1 Tax=Corynebacterium occultum TaxID=2675219 RepID=A0A6B8W7B3_9CORY|nr:DUF5129 domain-containing protein [Corynebacterium occultum]QGU08541.1 hypothetical protein COCCU_13210 [Corynebacterium occultum]
MKPLSQTSSRMSLSQLAALRLGLSRSLALGAVAGLAAAPMLLVGLAGTAGAGEPVPAAITADAPADESVLVRFHNPDGELSPTDEDFLRDGTQAIDLPASVSVVDYIILGENDDNLNDTIEEYGKEQAPEIIAADDNKFAPGHLIIAVGLDPSRMGTYCGDDVCNELGIYEDGRLDGILDEMEEPLQQGNWAAGMLAGAQAAADPTVKREGGEVNGTAVAVIASSVVAAGGAATAAGVIYSQKKKARTARERFGHVSANYGRVAQDLQAIDIRAHSLSSPLADTELRSQWEDVKGRFLSLHQQMDSLEGLDSRSPDKEFRKKAKEITSAHETVTQMETAEENIELLAKMEHGDPAVRQRELSSLHEDLLEAEVRAEDGALAQRLRELDQKVLNLRSELQAPDFMGRYSDLLKDAQILFKAVQDKMYTDLKRSTEHEVPRLYNQGWHPGFGYNNYVPFAMIYSWHQADHQAAQAAQSSSSSANTSFSSGFAGGGGSRGF